MSTQTTMEAPPRNLLQESRAADDKARAEARREYRTLLDRADTARKGDEARLRAVCLTLGIGLDEVAADLAALAKLKGLRARVAAQTDAALLESQNKAAAALDDHNKAAHERRIADDAEADRLMGELRGVHAARDILQTNINALKAMEADHPRLTAAE
jgi:hypothetical protein